MANYSGVGDFASGLASGLRTGAQYALDVEDYKAKKYERDRREKKEALRSEFEAAITDPELKKELNQNMYTEGIPEGQALPGPPAPESMGLSLEEQGLRTTSNYSKLQDLMARAYTFNDPELMEVASRTFMTAASPLLSRAAQTDDPMEKADYINKAYGLISPGGKYISVNKEGQLSDLNGNALAAQDLDGMLAYMGSMARDPVAAKGAIFSLVAGLQDARAKGERDERQVADQEKRTSIMEAAEENDRVYKEGMLEVYNTRNYVDLMQAIGDDVNASRAGSGMSELKPDAWRAMQTDVTAVVDEYKLGAEGEPTSPIGILAQSGYAPEIKDIGAQIMGTNFERSNRQTAAHAAGIAADLVMAAHAEELSDDQREALTEMYGTDLSQPLFSLYQSEDGRSFVEHIPTGTQFYMPNTLLSRYGHVFQKPTKQGIDPNG